MIDVRVIGSWGLVTLGGEYDIANAAEIRTGVGRLVDQGITDVTVDLSAVTFLGAAALGALVDVHDRLSASGTRMVIVGAAGLACLALAITGLDRVLPLGGSHADVEPSVPPEPSDVPPVRAPVVPLPAGTAGVVTGPAAGTAEDVLTRRLAELGRLLLDQETVSADLTRVVRAAVATVAGATAASVSLVVQGRGRTAAATDSVAIEVDVAQYTLDVGPCLDAARLRERIRVDVLGADERFRHLAPLALTAGVAAVLSVPIRHGGTVVGSLNVYSDRAFGPGTDIAADIVASQASAALAKSALYAAARKLTRSSLTELDHNRTVNTAEGILAGLYGVNLDEAGRLLAATAASSRDSVIEVAERITARVAEDLGSDRAPSPQWWPPAGFG